ncbi:MAG: hypothetical protein GF409_03505 [Candidatus Omnitrophica bacterium]|nr:hypothetical protein [Candidatus Omnitrophota bacterium]
MSEGNVSKCPGCGKRIAIDEEVDIDDMVICPECETELVVVEMEPVKLRVVEIGFDDDDDDVLSFEGEEDLSRYYQDGFDDYED